MMTLEPIVKTFYSHLEEGRIMGRRCAECGALEFPPVICCNSCSSTELEWTEVSGEAVMTSFVLPAVLSTKKENEHVGAHAYGCVTLAEGTSLNMLVLGVSPDMTGRLPVPLRAEILQRDGFKTVVFRVRD